MHRVATHVKKKSLIRVASALKYVQNVSRTPYSKQNARINILKLTKIVSDTRSISDQNTTERVRRAFHDSHPFDVTDLPLRISHIDRVQIVGLSNHLPL